jgi:hypothetical protein
MSGRISGPITGYMIVMQYHDRSGLLGTFGPYPSEDAAKAGIDWLEQMPMRQEAYEVVPVFGAPGVAAATS